FVEVGQMGDLIAHEPTGRMGRPVPLGVRQPRENRAERLLLVRQVVQQPFVRGHRSESIDRRSFSVPQCWSTGKDYAACRRRLTIAATCNAVVSRAGMLAIVGVDRSSGSSVPPRMTPSMFS